MFNYKKMCLTIIYSIFFSYSTNKIGSPCTNPRYIQCLKSFSYLLTAVRVKVWGKEWGDWKGWGVRQRRSRGRMKRKRVTRGGRGRRRGRSFGGGGIRNPEGFLLLTFTGWSPSSGKLGISKEEEESKAKRRRPGGSGWHSGTRGWRGILAN